MSQIIEPALKTLRFSASALAVGSRHGVTFNTPRAPLLASENE
jgi:hypothetical protein